VQRPPTNSISTSSPPVSRQAKVSGSSRTLRPRLRVKPMTAGRRMPSRKRDCSISALSTWPIGACPALRNRRSVRLNCSSSQNTMTVSASTTPRQP
jgi:hypothetical protein